MNTSSYPAPVDKLLTFGECRNFGDWPNYLELGFGPEHVNDLIRMATDAELNLADSDSLEVWAPTHAWRTLGQLRAEAAVAPLINLFDQIDPEDDWAPNELPIVMGMIGPAAIPALAAVVADPAAKKNSRTCAGESLAEIGQEYPESREACVKSLVAGLELFAQNAPELNGFFIANFLDLDAIEAAPVIERAFAAGRVDESIAGDWEDVQVEFGFIEERRTKPKYSIWDSIMHDNDDEEFYGEEEVDDEKNSFIDTLDGIHHNSKKTRRR